MFPTTTSRDVGIWCCVSLKHICGMEKPTGGKASGTRRVPFHATTHAGQPFLASRHFGYTFTIPTSGNVNC